MILWAKLKTITVMLQCSFWIHSLNKVIALQLRILSEKLLSYLSNPKAIALYYQLIYLFIFDQHLLLPSPFYNLVLLLNIWPLPCFNSLISVFAMQINFNIFVLFFLSWMCAHCSSSDGTGNCDKILFNINIEAFNTVAEHCVQASTNHFIKFDDWFQASRNHFIRFDY